MFRIGHDEVILPAFSVYIELTQYPSCPLAEIDR